MQEAQNIIDFLHPIPKGVSLEINSSWMKRWGKVAGIWTYKSSLGEPIGHVVRFEKDGVKSIITFQYSADGRWHPSGFAHPRPLYGQEEINGDLNKLYLIVEGEKAAEAAKKLIIGTTLSVLTWPNGSNSVKHAHWDSLRGRRVLIWRDADETGIKAQDELCEILYDLNCEVQYFTDDFYEGKPKGWDAADVDPNFNFAETMRSFATEYQRGGAGGEHVDVMPNKSAQEMPMNQYFKILGMQGNDFVFYNYISGQIVIESCKGLTKRFMYSLSNGNTFFWPQNYGYTNDAGDRKIEWDAAAAKIMADAARLGQFDTDRVRGLGCWRDNNKFIFNTGDYLYIDGDKTSIRDYESYFIYTRRTEIIKDMDNAVAPETLSKFVELCNMFHFEYPAAGNLLAGWLMIAPICGALDWRPHIYITGMSGAGKSTIYDQVLARTLGRSAVFTLGDSTKAGLSQSVMIDALPIVFDEIENDNKEDADRNEKVLKMARYASSSQHGATLKGRADQSGAESYVCRSAFCFSSITPSVKHYADINRITLLPLVLVHGLSKDEAAARFEKILRKVEEIMGDDPDNLGFSESFVTYATRNVESIRASYRVIRKQAFTGLQGFTQRIADQIGALLAGYWAYNSTKPITTKEADELLQRYNWEDLIPTRKQENQIQLVSKLAQHKLWFRNEELQDTRQIERTIADILEYISYPDITDHMDIRYYSKNKGISMLRNIGILYDETPDGKFVVISNTSEGLSKLLAGTQWASSWKDSFKAIPGAYTPHASKWFGNAIGGQRCTSVPLDVFLNPPV